MWIFTPGGFLSVVADRDRPQDGQLLVRARNREHLQALLPECGAFSVGGSDYPWRCWATREQVTDLLTQQVSALEYTNFKGAVSDHEYHLALMDVWQAMADYGDVLRYGPKAALNRREP